MDEVEEILAFVEKHEEGVQWGQIEGEFRKRRNWSKGKLVNHWKHAKSYLEKIQPKTGYPKYVTKPQYKILAEKAFLTRQIADAISKGEFKEFEVDPLHMNNLKRKMLEGARGYILMEATERTKRTNDEESLRKGLLESVHQFLSAPLFLFKELTKTKEEEQKEQVELLKFMMPLFVEMNEIEKKVEEGLDILTKNTRIRVIHPQNESMPSLIDKHLESLLDVASRYVVDEKGKLRTQFHILVSFYNPYSVSETDD